MSDVFVNASLSETQGLTLVEAAMCGLPIVSIYDDCYLDIVHDGENGYLVDADEKIGPAALALARDAKKKKTFGKKSAALSDRFTQKSFATAVEALYNDALKYYPYPLKDPRDTE
jgi:1,2-diacylglycerol 3-alpha-glucosyltransferase